MFHPDTYLTSLTALLQAAYGDRLCYVGLQGSYLRGEATETSDIDIMVVIRDMTVADLDAYRKAIESLDDFDKSCGFICGLEELRHWNPLEICHLLHTTKDHLGSLADLVPVYTENDVRVYVQLSLGNLYHELCHRYIHVPREESISALPGTYKSVFFILQNLHYLRSGRFIGTKAELLSALTGTDKQVLEVSLGCGEALDFGAAFSLLLSWCRDTLNSLQ
jgi:predicted nucleotidyltransferase